MMVTPERFQVGDHLEERLGFRQSRAPMWGSSRIRIWEPLIPVSRAISHHLATA
jgi:hypothetical protein